MKNLFDVSGKVALVTGGSRGIGEMIAEGFVANGVKTYISARKADACDATAARLSEQGECISIPADLSTTEGINELAGEIKSREGQLDILVNNAGATWGATIEEFPEAAWDKVMDINVKGPFFLTQALLPLLEASASAEDPARIINVGSILFTLSPSIEPTLIIRAGSSADAAASSKGSKAWVRKNGPLTFMSITLSQAASGNSSIVAPQVAPALFTRISS